MTGHILHGVRLIRELALDHGQLVLGLSYRRWTWRSPPQYGVDQDANVRSEEKNDAGTRENGGFHWIFLSCFPLISWKEWMVNILALA